ncbi:MAG: hypothetical protein ACODAC_09190 [Pseudomonadota bacterium]
MNRHANARARSQARGARDGPAWGSWVGIVAVVLGILLAAAHATEITRQGVMLTAAPADTRSLPAADCPADELEEEGLTLAECEQLVSDVRSQALSAPPWYPTAQFAIAGTGTLLALLSVIAGTALLDRRPWAGGAALAAFVALAAVDVAGFIAAVNAGPILRSARLWPLVVWFTLHLMLATAAAAGRRSDVAAETVP